MTEEELRVCDEQELREHCKALLAEVSRLKSAIERVLADSTVEERDFYKENYERLRSGYSDAISEVDRLNRLVDRLLRQQEGPAQDG